MTIGNRKSRAKVPVVWTARIREKGEATSNDFDMRSGDYVPAIHNPPPVMHPGAMDYAKHDSLGFRV